MARMNLGPVSGPVAMGLGLAVGAGLAFLLACPAWRRGSRTRYVGQSGEGGEDTTYDDQVDTAADESFPASDPPSHSAPRRAGRPRQH